MKIKSFYILICLVGIFSCKFEKDSKEAHVFQISGNLKTFEKEVILLQKDKATETKTLLIADKKRGEFYFKSKDSLPIGIYFIKIGSDPIRVPILVDNTDSKVYLDNLNLDQSYIEGTSNLQKEYNTYLAGSTRTDNQFAYQKKFVEENKHSLTAAIVLKDMLGTSPWRLKQTLILFEQLNTTVQETELGKEIEGYIISGFENMLESDETIDNTNEALNISEIEPKIIDINENKKTETEVIPTPITKKNVDYAPFFYADDLHGNEISAQTIFTKNKLTLLDFWASWCVPCRAQNPDYVRLYNKYHSKGFEILSIASDKNETNWRNAIYQDDMEWLHINDAYNRIANTYAVYAIPNAILVNQNGEILAKKLSVSRLENLLQNEIGE